MLRQVMRGAWVWRKIKLRSILMPSCVKHQQFSVIRVSRWKLHSSEVFVLLIEGCIERDFSGEWRTIFAGVPSLNPRRTLIVWLGLKRSGRCG